MRGESYEYEIDEIWNWAGAAGNFGNGGEFNLRICLDVGSEGADVGADSSGDAAGSSAGYENEGKGCAGGDIQHAGAGETIWVDD